MRRTMFCALIALGVVGMAHARGRWPDPVMGTGCAPLRTAEDLLGLTREQRAQTRGLAENYNKDFGTEMEKAAAALDEKYQVEVMKVLSDEQKEQLKALMVADEAYKEAVAKIDEECRTKLLGLFYGAEDSEKKTTARQRLKRLPRDENGLLQTFSVADDAFREQYTALRSKHVRATADIHSEARNVDWKDAKARTEWQKQRTERLKAANEKHMQEVLELMNEEQSAKFAKALEAHKKWQEATKTAEDIYVKSVEGVIGPGKARQIKRHQTILKRGLMY